MCVYLITYMYIVIQNTNIEMKQYFFNVTRRGTKQHINKISKTKC